MLEPLLIINNSIKKIMFTGQVIGYLGADAKEIKKEEKVTLSFSVSSNYKDKDGNERTTWVSCFYPASSPKLAEYLKKGTMVYVYGEISVDVFRKEDGTAIPDIRMSVRKVELCGSRHAD